MNLSILLLWCAVVLFKKCEGNCSPLPARSNGQLRYSQQARGSPPRYPSGTYATVLCDTGHYQTANGRTCNGNRWSYPDVQCQASCLDAVHSPNGDYVFNTDPLYETGLQNAYPIGTVMSLVCDEGFLRDGGPETWECRTGDYHYGGAWFPTSATADCKASCGTLSSLPNGVIQYSTQPVDGKYIEGTRATFGCSSGHSLSGHDSRTCQASGDWNQETPSCNANPPPSPPPSSGGGPCFPSMAEVQLKNGKTVTMSELEIGDEVQTVSSSGNIIYSEVKTFLVKQSGLTGMYMSMTTNMNTTVSMTKTHLIYARRHSTEKFNPIYAYQISSGDEVLVQGNDEMAPAMVINVSMLINKGFYSPLTLEGNIVVDRVLTSCYASFDHDLAHVTMTPTQWFPETTEWIFGNINGNSIYVEISKSIGRLILPTGQIY